MDISHKALLNRTSNQNSNLETKPAYLENGIKETIEEKVEKAIDGEKDEKFFTNVQEAVKSLLKSDDFKN